MMMPGEHQGEPKLRPVSSFTLSDAGERAKLTARSTETTCPHTLTTEWVDCDSNSTNYHIWVAQSISDRLKNLITRIYVGNCSAHFFELNCLCSGQVQAEIPLGKGKENIMFSSTQSPFMQMTDVSVVDICTKHDISFHDKHLFSDFRKIISSTSGW